ncbi:hypothetical protein JTE90_014067, partial [Oedothorax gibbosus]
LLSDGYESDSTLIRKKNGPKPGKWTLKPTQKAWVQRKFKKAAKYLSLDYGKLCLKNLQAPNYSGKTSKGPLSPEIFIDQPHLLSENSNVNTMNNNKSRKHKDIRLIILESFEYAYQKS